MVLTSEYRWLLILNLKRLEKIPGYEKEVEILKVILEVNSSFETIQQEIPRLRQLIDTGSVEAVWLLGFCLEMGLGVAKDHKQAFELLQRATMQGSVTAKLLLGICYIEGHGIAKDQKRAMELYQETAEFGYAPAQHWFATVLTGGNVPRNVDYALELWHLSSAAGHPIAQCSLGRNYEMSIGLSENLKRAAILYQRASEIGHGIAQFFLEPLVKKLKKKKKITIPNLAEAITCYTKQKDYSTLGFCHQMGAGTEQDLKLAVECYQKAIEQGNPCFRDLLLCYKMMPKQAINKSIMDTFFKDLEMATASSDPSIQNDALLCLAYAHEKGAPFLDQNLFKAILFYQKAEEITKITEKDVKEGKERFALLPTFDLQVRNANLGFNTMNASIISIIAEYAFDADVIKAAEAAKKKAF